MNRIIKYILPFLLYSCNNEMSNTEYMDEINKLYNDAFEQKRYNDCINTLNKIISILPNEHSFLFKKANCFRMLANIDSASYYYNESLKYGINVYDCHYYLGYGYFTKGWDTLSIYHLKQALLVEPNNKNSEELKIFLESCEVNLRIENKLRDSVGGNVTKKQIKI